MNKKMKRNKKNSSELTNREKFWKRKEKAKSCIIFQCNSFSFVHKKVRQLRTTKLGNKAESPTRGNKEMQRKQITSAVDPIRKDQKKKKKRTPVPLGFIALTLQTSDSIYLPRELQFLILTFYRRFLRGVVHNTNFLFSFGEKEKLREARGLRVKNGKVYVFFVPFVFFCPFYSFVSLFFCLVFFLLPLIFLLFFFFKNNRN